MGMDGSEKMIAIARERYGGIEATEFRVGRLESIPYADASFDASFALRTLQYLEEPLLGLREMMRVTRPGGRIVVAEGGMSVADLPLPDLAGILGDESWRAHPAFGVSLYRMFIEARLTRVKVEPATVVETKVSGYFERYVRHATS